MSGCVRALNDASVSNSISHASITMRARFKDIHYIELARIMLRFFLPCSFLVPVINQFPPTHQAPTYTMLHFGAMQHELFSDASQEVMCVCVCCLSSSKRRFAYRHAQRRSKRTSCAPLLLNLRLQRYVVITSTTSGVLSLHGKQRLLSSYRHTI